jgi:regulatory protein
VERSALDVATRSLARRDRSETDLRRILARKGVSEEDAEAALETLRTTGAVDDRRFAFAAAQTLARKGFGDRAVVFRLGREGIERELAEEAVASLAPEAERAADAVARRGPGERTLRWLRARCFSRDSIDHAMAAIAEEEAWELG